LAAVCERYSRTLSRLQDRLRRASLLVLDELGFVPFEKAGGELLFDVMSARHERAATIITSNLAFSEWSRVFGDDNLTAALLDRLAQHVAVCVTRGPVTVWRCCPTASTQTTRWRRPRRDPVAGGGSIPGRQSGSIPGGH
jgi:hypothetical protein